MGEKTIPAKAIIVDYICDECGEGRMRWFGRQLLCNPPLYPHICNGCNAEKNLDHVYPKEKIVAECDDSCDHDFHEVFPSMGDPSNPSGMRCKKCGKQVWF